MQRFATCLTITATATLALLAPACMPAEDADTTMATESVPDLPATPYAYSAITLPAHFQTPGVLAKDNTPTDNPITDLGATLGRVLFHDTALSANDAVACASCHLQEYGFSDPAQLSVGFEGGLTGRNSMSIANARFYQNGHFFWDERADTLEDQVLMPIQDSTEMGMTLEELEIKLAARSYYPELFEQAFGDPAITSDRISRALAQFVRSIVSYRSRYDEGLTMVGGDPQSPFPNYSAQENQGKALFFGPRGGCAVCHVDNGPPGPGQVADNAAIFFIDVAVNNGLDPTLDASDQGVGAHTGNTQDIGKFKSPSLRNVAVTGPYMHDGRLETLRQVVEFYNSDVQPHPNLDPRLRTPDGQPRRLGLTPAEIDALVAFLETLTDEAMMADVMYSDPFI